MSIHEFVSPEEDIVRVTELGRLHTIKRSNSVFRSNTPVELHASRVAHGIEFSVLIGKPIRSNDLAQILKSFSELPYSAEIAIAQLSDAEEDEFGGGVKSSLKVLGKLLEAPDDTNFLTNLAGRIKSHDQAWSDLVSQRSFATRLAEQISGNATRTEFYDTARRVVEIMRLHPELWTERQRSEGHSKSETLIERFTRLTPPQRGSILDEEMRRFDDVRQEQKERIAETNGIRFELEYGGKTWYLTGKEGEVKEVKENLFQITSGENTAIIQPTSEGFIIRPRSGFLLPTLTWINENGRRRLVVPSKFDKKQMTIPSQNNRSVNFVYPIDPRQLANPIVGLVALQYILDTPPFKDLPPEKAPELAVLRKAEILQSDFIRNVESLVPTI